MGLDRTSTVQSVLPPKVFWELESMVDLVQDLIREAIKHRVPRTCEGWGWEYQREDRRRLRLICEERRTTLALLENEQGQLVQSSFIEDYDAVGRPDCYFLARDKIDRPPCSADERLMVEAAKEGLYATALPVDPGGRVRSFTISHPLVYEWEDGRECISPYVGESRFFNLTFPQLQEQRPALAQKLPQLLSVLLPQLKKEMEGVAERVRAALPKWYESVM